MQLRLASKVSLRAAPELLTSACIEVSLSDRAFDHGAGSVSVRLLDLLVDSTGKLLASSHGSGMD